MGEEKRKREERTVSEADKALKSPRLEGQAVARKSQEILGLRAVQVVPASPSDSSRSDSDGNSAPCHHQCLDSESVDIAVFAIKDSKELPTCHYPGCGITWKGASESKEGMMKCMECHYISCAGWPVDRGNPQRHALWHFANFPNHYVAQWYDAPSLGYCFECKRFMRLTDEEDQSSDDEGSEVNRKVNDDQEMVASKTTDLQGMVAGKTTDQRKMVASSSKVDWAMVASNSKVDLAMVASNAMDQWGMLARDDASRCATGDGYVIRGMPNHGNTCYMNASLQCLLALGKLRTTILSPDARLGYIGLELKQLFVETSSVSNARHTPDPKVIRAYMQSLHPKRFIEEEMEDSHEFLRSLHAALDYEVMKLNKLHVEQKEERVSEADKVLKSPRLEGQAVARKSLESLGQRDVQAAPASPERTSSSDSDGNSGPCQIFVKTISGMTLSVQIELSKSSEELASLIHKRTIFSQADQYLEYQGHILKPKTKLSEQGIIRDSTVMIRSRLCGGTVVLTQIPFANILQWRPIPGRVDHELEFNVLGLRILRGVVRSVISNIDDGMCWDGTLRLEDFDVENGNVYPNRAATVNSNPVRIHSNLDDLATSIENHFVVGAKRPAYLDNLIEKLRNSQLIWEQTLQRHCFTPTYRLVLLSHFAGLPSMCKVNVVYQLKIYFDKLGKKGKRRFKKALKRCRLRVGWLVLVSSDRIVKITFLNGRYKRDPFSAFLLSRNYFSIHTKTVGITADSCMIVILAWKYSWVCA